MTRRQTLLRHAVELFAARGYTATPTAEIARRAEVAEGTLFHHFKTKDAMLLEILSDVFDRHFEQAKSRIEDAPTGLWALEALVEFHFSFARGHRDEMLVAVRDFPYHLVAPGSDGHAELMPKIRRHLGLFVGCLEQGIADGSIRRVPVAETAHVLRSLVIGATRVTLLGPLDAPDMTRAAVELCRRGLS